MKQNKLKHLQILLLIKLVFFSFESHATNDVKKKAISNPADEKILSTLCVRPEPHLLKSIKIKDNPEFFFRPFPLTDRLTYSAAHQNFVLDMNTGKTTKIDGQYDGFPTADEKLFIIAQGTSGLSLFDLKDLKKPLLTDKKMTGYYQSAGIYKDQGGHSVYRVMADAYNVGFMVQDYVLDVRNKSLTAMRENPIPLCANLRGVSLPMLSKDGQLLAAYDSGSQATNIYSIDSKSGSCTFKKSLGVAAGKVDFSFDGKLVTYAQNAVASYENESGDRDYWMRRPKGDMVSNIFVKNLQTGETTALTHFHDTNALYPAFNMKGNIIARKFDGNGAEFITIDPRVEPRIKTVSDPKVINECTIVPKDLSAALGIGALFLKYCARELEKWNLQSIILLGRDLSKDQCRLLAKWWEKPSTLDDISFLKVPLSRTNIKIEALKELNSHDILAACAQ